MDEFSGTRMTSSPANTHSLLDIKKIIMVMRNKLHGRPTVIIREDSTNGDDPGNTYDLPIMGREWHKPINFSPRVGGSGRNIKYIVLMLSEVGHLAPYQCLECNQEVHGPGGTCGDCAVLLGDMNIRDF